MAGAPPPAAARARCSSWAEKAYDERAPRNCTAPRSSGAPPRRVGRATGTHIIELTPSAWDTMRPAFATYAATLPLDSGSIPASRARAVPVRLPGGAVAQRASTSRESSRVSTATECAATLSCIAMPSVPTAPPSARVDAEAASRSRRACRSRCATNTCKCCPTSAASAAAVATSASRRRSARSSKARRTWPSATRCTISEMLPPPPPVVIARPSPASVAASPGLGSCAYNAPTSWRPESPAKPCLPRLSSSGSAAGASSGRQSRIVASGALPPLRARGSSRSASASRTSRSGSISTRSSSSPRQPCSAWSARSYKSSATCSQPSTSRPAVSRLRHTVGHSPPSRGERNVRAARSEARRRVRASDAMGFE